MSVHGSNPSVLTIFIYDIRAVNIIVIFEGNLKNILSPVFKLTMTPCKSINCRCCGCCSNKVFLFFMYAL